LKKSKMLIQYDHTARFAEKAPVPEAHRSASPQPRKAFNNDDRMTNSNTRQRGGFWRWLSSPDR
jgi:hypothetical protein